MMKQKQSLDITDVNLAYKKLTISTAPKMPVRTEWKVKASIVAKNTFNPIRNILETMDITPHPQKKMISLSIGDPTVFGNLKPAKEVVDAVKATLDSGVNNGYGPSTGFAPSRQAVADYASVPGK